MCKGLILTWFLTSSTADAVSTELALRRPNTVEVNPLMQGGLPERATLRVGATLGATYLFVKLWPNHPKLTAIAVSAVSSEFTVLAIHNMRVR